LNQTENQALKHACGFRHFRGDQLMSFSRLPTNDLLSLLIRITPIA
jgi:hypothetical protein